MVNQYQAFGDFLIVATAAHAHQRIQNQAVNGRMDNMGEMADHVKVILQMLKGKSEFDADAARKAAVEDLSPAMKRLGASCKSCHSVSLV